MAPPYANFKRVYATGMQTAPTDVSAIINSVTQEGAFDYQRDATNKVYYEAYRHAANYAVGVFMAGVGFPENWPSRYHRLMPSFDRSKLRKIGNSRCFGRHAVGTMGIEGIGSEIAGMVRMDRLCGQPCPYSRSSRFPLCLDAPFDPAVPYRPCRGGIQCTRRPSSLLKKPWLWLI